MTLTRHWTPTKNYSGGSLSNKRLLVIHTMEGFTGPNGAYDCAHYFQGSGAGASAQVCIDNNRGHVWEGVTRDNGAWTQCNYNGAAISCEQSGYASWSESYWFANRDAQLHNIADWLAEESAATGIPLVLLTESQAQGSGRGVCFHKHLGSAGCGHVDPGSGWPVNQVLAWANGQESAPVPPEAITPEPEEPEMLTDMITTGRWAVPFPDGSFDRVLLMKDPIADGFTMHVAVILSNGDRPTYHPVIDQPKVYTVKFPHPELARGVSFDIPASALPLSYTLCYGEG